MHDHAGVRCAIISEARCFLIALLMLPYQQGDTMIIDRAFEPLAWFIRCTFLSHPVVKYRYNAYNHVHLKLL